MRSGSLHVYWMLNTMQISVAIWNENTEYVYVRGLMQVKTLISSMPIPLVNVSVSFLPRILGGSGIDFSVYGNCNMITGCFFVVKIFNFHDCLPPTAKRHFQLVYVPTVCPKTPILNPF